MCRAPRHSLCGPVLCRSITRLGQPDLRRLDFIAPRFRCRGDPARRQQRFMRLGQRLDPCGNGKGRRSVAFDPCLYLAFPTAKLVRKIGRFPSQNSQALAQSPRNHVATSLPLAFGLRFCRMPGKLPRHDARQGTSAPSPRSDGSSRPIGPCRAIGPATASACSGIPSRRLEIRSSDASAAERSRCQASCSWQAPGHSRWLPAPSVGRAGLFSGFRSPCRRPRAWRVRLLSSASRPPSPRW